MYYIGCQNGLWAQVLKEYLPKLSVVGVEANPSVFAKYAATLNEIEGFTYLNKVVSPKCGFENLYIPTQKSELKPINTLDNFVFRKYHNETYRYRESWRTDATIVPNTLGTTKYHLVKVPSICLPHLIDLYHIPRPSLLFMDIEGAELQVLQSFMKKSIRLNKLIDLAFLEVTRNTKSDDPTTEIPKLMKSMGFKYLANDKFEANSHWHNDFYVSKKLDLNQVNSAKNDWDKIEIREEKFYKKTLASRIGDIWCRGLVLRLLYFIGFKIY
jgi:FkbM family methyltransferase